MDTNSGPKSSFLYSYEYRNAKMNIETQKSAQSDRSVRGSVTNHFYDDIIAKKEQHQHKQPTLDRNRNFYIHMNIETAK